jgi:hypothetical protein
MAGLLFAPALGLAGRAIIDLNVVDQTMLIAEAAVAALAILALFYRFDARLKADWRPALTIAIWAMVYGYGVLAFVNTVSIFPRGTTPSRSSANAASMSRAVSKGAPSGTRFPSMRVTIPATSSGSMCGPISIPPSHAAKPPVFTAAPASLLCAGSSCVPAAPRRAERDGAC